MSRHHRRLLRRLRATWRRAHGYDERPHLERCRGGWRLTCGVAWVRRRRVEVIHAALAEVRRWLP